jgi:predicted amidohydrolase/ribosomal protein S18 acetylase RimI-like enzyme
MPQERPTSPAIKVRRARPDDVPAIYACEVAAYSSFQPSGLCDERLLKMQIETFPDGQLVATSGKRIIGYAMSLIVQLDDESPWHSYAEITGDGTFSTHDPAGDTLYGADIAVDPEFRGQGIAGRLYEGRRKILRRFNLRRMVAGGRIPGYRAHAGKISPEEYVERVKRGDLKDPALNAHLKAGYSVHSVHMGYLHDEQSLSYATFLEMDNPTFRPTLRRIAASPMKRPVRKIRVCSAQYQMRRVSSWEEFEQQVEFFVWTAAEYHCHFLVFPELFTVQLFSMLDTKKLSPVDAIVQLAGMTDRYREMFTRMAKRTGLYIVGGSHPVHAEGGIRNVGHLFTPTGNVYTQDKLHITPDERREYGIQAGEGLRVFETGHARVGILVCYDVEFPELARLQALAGAEVIFVPFSTDERKAYLRVRYTAQARAVENGIYTVLSGNVGNLPQVENFLINYGQAAIFTPSDFSFPPDGIAGNADSNSETVVISDLDLVVLEEAREMGSVRPLRDRRPDLYDVVARNPVEVIRAS